MGIKLCKNISEGVEGQGVCFARTHGQNNPKTSNILEFYWFEYTATERITKALNTTKDNGTTETI